MNDDDDTESNVLATIAKMSIGFFLIAIGITFLFRWMNP